MNKYLSLLTNKQAQDFAKKGVDLFAKLPHLPKKIIDFLVKILPFLILLAGIASISSAIQNVFAFNQAHRWLTNWVKINRSYYYVTGIFELISGIIYLLAFDKLKNRKYDGWMLIFWTTCLEVAQSLITLIFGWNSIFSLILSTAIGFYFIYEIRPSYTTLIKKSVKTEAPTKKKTSSKKK